MVTAPKIVYGTAGVVHFSDDQMNQVLNSLKKYNVDHLDTAYIYGDSEITLKKYSAPDNFIIDTKAPGWQPKTLTKESVLAGLKESQSRLGSKKIETYYLHAPDKDTPIEETLEAITQLYNEGNFKKFGLSNYAPDDVQKIYDIQKANNAVLPTVFQGNYNALSRHVETDLFPILRKLKMSFYAYSPIAGGFLVKDPEMMRSQGGTGRWDKDSPFGQMYHGMYGKESLLSALDQWGVIAKEEGISKAALAYRWITYHSALQGEEGDAVIIGATKPSQLEESLDAIKQGPLSEKSAKSVDEIWNKIEHEAPRDNYHK